MVNAALALFAAVAVNAVEGEAPSLLPEGREFSLVWHDEFNGDSLDTSKWMFRTNFWGRRFEAFAAPEQNALEIKGGMAHLKLIKRADGEYASPQLQTGELMWDYPPLENPKTFWSVPPRSKPKFEHRYGYYECRCRLQQCEGWWSAFWMQSITQGACLEPERAGIEHDIMESFEPGVILPACFHMNGCGAEYVGFHAPRMPKKGSWQSRVDAVSMKLDKTLFHVFGLLWEEDGYTVFVDGVQRGEKVGREGKERVSHVPEFLLVSTEPKWYRKDRMTGKAVPELEAAWKAGDEFIVDYVRVYDIVDRKRLCVAGSLAGSHDLQALKVLDCDPESGAARVVQEVNGMQGTTYCKFSSDGRTLYSAISRMRGGKNRGMLVSFKVENGRIGEMKHLVQLPCEVPCHVELSADGRYLAFAAYSSATCGTFDLRSGALRSAVLPDVGMGPVADRQKKAYAHCAFFTPDQKKLGIVNLGCDRIHFFDPEDMVEDEKATIVFDPGDGPRHVVWSADRRFLYVVNELGNSVTMFSYELGRFVRRGKWSTIPEGFNGFSKASAIKLTADGSRLLASNRGHDSIAVFAVNPESGLLSLLNIAPLEGKFPRDFEFMPGEKFVVVGHKMSDEIRVYAFDREKGALSPVGDAIPSYRPLYFKFMPSW